MFWEREREREGQRERGRETERGRERERQTNTQTDRLVLPEQPARLGSGEGYGLGGEGGRIDVTAHQDVHLFLGLHLRLLDHRSRVRQTGQRVVRVGPFGGGGARGCVPQRCVG